MSQSDLTSNHSNPEELEFTLTPCSACNHTSTENEQMIGCDSCNRWFHHRCLGLTDAVKKEKRWFCQEVACQEAEKKLKRSKKKKPDPVLTQEQRLKAMEEEHKKKMQELAMEKFLKDKEVEFKLSLKEKQMQMEREIRETEMAKEKLLLERALKEKTQHLEKMKVMRKKYQKNMDDVEQELNDLRSQNPGKPSAKKLELKIHQKVETKDGVENQNGTSENVAQNGKEDSDSEEEADDEDEEADDEDDEDDDDVTDDDNDDDEESVVSKDKGGSKGGRNPDGLGQQCSGPTKMQIAARSGVTKKLPVFTGKPEDWPLFYGTYQASNEACGFTDVENLVRLQESLKGPALESVRGQLILPKSVPKAIKKLRQLYGRPELILQSHLNRIKQLESPKSDKLASFIPFGNAIEQLCEHLEAAGLEQHLINPILIQELVDKLPAGDKREWVRYKRKKKKVTLRTFTDFVAQIVDEACEANVSLEQKHEPKAVGTNRGNFGSINDGSKGRSKEKAVLLNHGVVENKASGSNDKTKQKPCKACQRTDHRLRFCEDFRRLSHADRTSIVSKWKLCNICLNDHGNATCKFKIRCNVGDCQQKHNPLLHPVEGVVGTTAHIQTADVILFRMIPIRLHYGSKTVTTLAFLDEGASITLIEKTLVDHLGIVGVPERLTMTWTADVTREEKGSTRISVWTSSVAGGEKLLLNSVHTVESLRLPKQSLNAVTISNQYTHLQNLPITSYPEARPGLIGINNIDSLAPLEVKLGAPGEPIAVRCKLGWTVYGPKMRGTSNVNGVLGFHDVVTNEDLHDLLRTQYALEESVVAVKRESKEDERAVSILERTTKRVGNRFETGLLWKTDEVNFPDSFPMAVKRMKQLEQKLEKNPPLFENVCRQITEYVQKGYAHQATPEEIAGTDPRKVWYLPLNVVLNPRKPGKVRLVWDASATVDGVSLNSQLLTGPDLLTPLVNVLTGFREYRIAFGGDTREMYHQMKIIDGDKQMQRFVFRMKKADPPSIYVMDVATFGSTSSPCSAQFVKNKNAMEFASEFPDAAAAIIKRHYVDDYLDSVDTVEEAIRRAKEVRFIQAQGGFEIRNWVSNSPEFRHSLGEKNAVQEIHFGRVKETGSERVLGIIWNPDEDTFSFSTEHREHLHEYLSGSQRPTKRLVLSCVMGFFDPLGLLTPFTVHGKTLVQDLWRTGCSWDEEIDESCWVKWKRWIGLLPQVEAIRIPRCYFGNFPWSSVKSVELHIFTDASEYAYGCVGYLRAVVQGTVICSLIMSRSKVAPLKRQSVPRLELMAAVMGARMLHSVLDTHSIKFERYVLWTDSQTVRSWIFSDQHKFKQFVAFRIGEVLELTRPTDWRWVTSKLNAADVLTKWGQGPPLESSGPWFTGPQFLYESETKWPTQAVPAEQTQEEARSFVVHHNVTQGVIDGERFSRWNRLLRSTAMVLRFLANCRRKKNGQPLLTSKATRNQMRMIRANLLTECRPLQQDELFLAETVLWKQVQSESFPDEKTVLTKNQDRSLDQPLIRIEKSSILYKLTPVLDQNGVVRVGGRMEAAESLPFDKKYPIILSRSHEITRKLILSYHEKFGHANRETVFNELRQKFHIPNLRAAIGQVTRSCMKCKVLRCRPRVPMMAPLPVQRISPQLRPFSAVGVDYLGPVEVSVGRRTEKRWIALFTCLTIRAVHLEIAHSLSSQSCLMAIKRFICKRGCPEEFFSDNGTNFKGASKEVLEVLNHVENDCAEAVTSATTKWNFNPPGAPHMGGIWERMVRSVKEAINVLNDGRKLTDEILQTTLSEAEDMINTRPLTYIPQESADIEAITPNHFLRGTVRGTDAKLDGSVTFAEALRDVYKRSQYLADRMWERWSKEYLPTINKRTKWFDDPKPLQVGDLVFITDGKNRKKWTRGVVEEVFGGKDGRIRQAKVRTAGGVYRRATANLAVLEVEEGKSGTSGGSVPELRAGELSTPLG